MEINPIINSLKDITERTEVLRGYLEYPEKQERLEEVNRELEDSAVWSEPERAQALGKERAMLEGVVQTIDDLTAGVTDARELLEMAVDEDDEDTVEEVRSEVTKLEELLNQLEFRRMFSGEADANNAYLDIQAGSGGTEAQDWAEMMLRMYLRWGEDKGFKTELLECSAGDVAGIKSATISFQGAYAFGWLRTETGVHRLVRKSPFDSGGRRHTSFSSVFVSPEIDDNVEIDINPADLRVDVYRASGAGGQHINKTDSAIRVTHLPTGLVVECQDERSQHKNRAKALAVLATRLRDAQRQAAHAEQAATRKSLVGSGDRSERIRTYNYPQGRVTDHRINLTLYKLDEIVQGDLIPVIGPLAHEHQANLLAEMSGQ
jgi:peptide chain release factor 2